MIGPLRTAQVISIMLILAGSIFIEKGRKIRNRTATQTLQSRSRIPQKMERIMEFIHKSVLLDECIDSLNIKPEGIYVDGTLGGAGHSLEIVKEA